MSYRQKPDPKRQLAEALAAPKIKGKKFGINRDRSKYGKRHTPGVMNQTEEAYAAILEGRKQSGEVIDWIFEAVTFKLADRCTYTPDFQVFCSNGVMEFVDSKGGGPIDPKSVVKIKAAAEKFWMFSFVMEQRKAKKDGGGWKRTEY